jgi:hypothetical protein
MSSDIMSSGSGTNPSDITADGANPTDTAAHNTRAYNASKHNEFNNTVFEAPTTFGTPLCFVFRWGIACG